ncbi:MAG: DUF1667 domain-containing protein [Rectinemataceae bacterium]
MSQELVCITCPMGCRLKVDRGEEGSLTVTGNRCQRGAAYAREELLAPKRTVTATCKAVSSASEDSVSAAPRLRRVPCRTSAPFPREKVRDLLRVIYGREVQLPVRLGQVLIADALESGIDVIATRSIF